MIVQIATAAQGHGSTQSVIALDNWGRIYVGFPQENPIGSWNYNFKWFKLPDITGNEDTVR